MYLFLNTRTAGSAPNNCAAEKPYLYEGSTCITGSSCPPAGYAKYTDNTGNALCSPCPEGCAECGFEENSNGVLTYCRSFCEAVARRPFEINEVKNWNPSNENWSENVNTKFCMAFATKSSCNNGTVRFYNSKMRQLCWWDFTRSSEKCQATSQLVSSTYPDAYSHKKDAKCCGMCKNCKFGLYHLASKVDCAPECPTGEFVSQEYTSNGNNGTCAYCSENCASCTSLTSCLNCTNGTFLASDNSSCVISCADGFSPVNGRCQTFESAPLPTTSPSPSSSSFQSLSPSSSSFQSLSPSSSSFQSLSPSSSSFQSLSPSSSSTSSAENTPQDFVDDKANRTSSLNGALPQDISTLSSEDIADQMLKREAIANDLFRDWMQAWVHTVNRNAMVGFLSQTVATLTSLTIYPSLLNINTKFEVLELLGSMLHSNSRQYEVG